MGKSSHHTTEAEQRRHNVPIKTLLFHLYISSNCLSFNPEPYPTSDLELTSLDLAVLNLHGEVLESLAPAGETLEEAFLPTLKTLHDRFPQLRIVVRISSFSFVRGLLSGC